MSRVAMLLTAVSVLVLVLLWLAVLLVPARVCWPSAVGVECLERGR